MKKILRDGEIEIKRYKIGPSIIKIKVGTQGEK